MSARRNISQRTAPPNQQQQNNVRSAMNGARFMADGQQQQQQDAPIDIKKMHPMAVLSLHEDRLNEIDTKISQFQTQLTSNQSSKRSTGDESAMIAECIKQIKFLTQENQTNRNLARELTLELLRLKTSLQEDGRIEMHISEETQDKYDAFKEKANANSSNNNTQSQSVREELMPGADTMSFSGNGGYDPNAL